MTEYAVNLPKTSLPMRADLPKREPKMLAYWQTIDLYKTFASTENTKGAFVLHDGPPYANGEIHLGHAFNKILKDIINKTKLLDGYSVPYVPGWDCHGLPIELNVEKKIGKAGVKTSIDEFITECRKYAATQVELQKSAFQRLGVIGDWDNPYQTMNFTYEANTVRALAKILTNDHVVRGYKPVHWCTACGSALAEAEVEYRDKTSPAIDVKFKVVNPELFQVAAVSIPIWTTTPWTLPANEAVCVHPEFNYVLVRCQDLNEHFVVLEELLAATMQRFGETNYHIINNFLGKSLATIKLQHPFLTDKIVPVILGEHVTTDAGTGAVHTAPAHGQEDYKVGLGYNLPINNPVGPNGKFLATTPLFAGLDVFAANDQVITVLKEQGTLIHATTLQHSYPHCWRHKTPLIFRATQQWFISMDKLRQPIAEQIEAVNWLPAKGKERIKSMAITRPDWCISRQRIWGTPITLLVHKATGAIHPNMQQWIADIIAPGIEQIGISYWRNLNAEEFLRQQADANYQDYEKVTDTLDVWFDSGVSHYAVLGQRSEQHLPADLYVEGSDQYRGWFQSSLLTSVAMTGVAPYQTVLSHGFTVDAKGYKMSKSVGNVIAPQAVIEKYGADILRLWVSTNDFHGDITVSDEIFARSVDAYRLIRNTARFLLGNLAGFDFDQDLVAPSAMLAIDRFAVAKMLKLMHDTQEHYNNYHFYLAGSQLQVMLANEISSFYFSVIKDRLYTMAPKSLGRRSAQTALLHILEILVRLIAPVLSFTAEEIWQELKQLEQTAGNHARCESVFMARWYSAISSNDFDLTTDMINEHDWQVIQEVRLAVNKELERLRVAGEIGSSLAAEVTLCGDANTVAVLQKLAADLRFVFITAQVDLVITADAELKIVAAPSGHKKCARCWHYREDVGANAEHPELCDRCMQNLFGSGETRCAV